jgi:hypothetical protein
VLHSSNSVTLAFFSSLLFSFSFLILVVQNVAKSQSEKNIQKPGDSWLNQEVWQPCSRSDPVGMEPFCHNGFISGWSSALYVWFGVFLGNIGAKPGLQTFIIHMKSKTLVNLV